MTTKPACTQCGTKPAHGRGLCVGCYGTARRLGTLPPSTRRPRGQTCEAPDCDRAAVSNGLCEGHRGQQRRGAPFTAILTAEQRRRADGRPDCTVEGCERVAERKGVCRRHRETRVVTTACRFPGCPHPHAAKGWCKGHWRADREGWTMKPIGERAPRRTPRRPVQRQPRPVSVLPTGWDKVTPPKKHTRTKTSVRPDALGPLTPLDLGTVAAMALVVANLGDGRYTEDGLDLMDALNLREMAAEARARLAVAS